MANGLKVYKIEDSQTGKVYEIEGPEGATDEELYSFLENDLGSAQPSPQPKAPAAPVAGPVPVSNSPAPQQELVPNAMLGANVRTGEATRTLKDFPEGQSFLRDQFYNRKKFGEAQAEFNKRYSAMGVELPSDMAGIWAENQAYLDTPAGRQHFKNNDPIAPVQLATGVEDVNTPDSVLEEGGMSALRSLANMANTVTGATALVADLFGADETAQALADDYLEKQAAIGIEYPTAAGQAVDIQSFDDFGMWAASTLGELGPQLTASLGGGAVGGLAARKLVERKAADFVEQRVAEGAVRELAEKEVARQIQKATVKGGIVGAGAVGEVQEVGSVYGDTYAETGELKPWTSLLAGTAAASLDTILPARILSKVGGPVVEGAIVDSLVKKVGKEGASSFLLEGGTEALQTVIEQLPSGEVDWDQVVETALRGGFGGSVAGGAVGAFEGSRQNAPNLDSQPRTAVPEGSAPISVPDALPKRSAGYKAAIEKSRSQVEQRTKELTASWENAPEVEVHTNFQKIKGVSNSAIGVYADGKLQLNTENIIKEARRRGVTPDDIVSAVTFHEGLGHHGLLQLFGEELDTKLSTILANSPVYQARVDAWLKKNPDAYENDPNRDLRAMEELLAEKSEGGRLPATFVNQMKNTIKDFGRRMWLDLEYSTREVETILGMAHAAVVNGKGRDASSNGFRFMYLGQNAQNANLSRLEGAKAFLRAGVDKEEVRKKLGWFEGPDGKWRYEINDSSVEVVKTEGTSNLTKLNTVSPSPQVLPNKTPEESLQYYQNRLNGLKERLARNDPNDDKAKIQSAIESFQRKIDSLLKPANPTYYFLNDIIEHPELFEAYPELKGIQVSRKYIEDETFDANANGGFYDPSLNLIHIGSELTNQEALSVLLHEVQHAVQGIEGFASGGSRESAMEALSDDLLLKGSRQYLTYLEANPLPGSEKEKKAFFDLFQGMIDRKETKQLRNFFKKDPRASYEAYQHLFGEVEARDVQARQGMTDGQRRAYEPYSMEPNIDPESYIFDMRDEGKSGRAESRKPSNDNYSNEEQKYLLKADETEKKGRTSIAEDYRHRAALERKIRLDKEGNLSLLDRIKYFREATEYYQKKMDQRAARGDAQGIERYRMFRDDASYKAAQLAEAGLSSPTRYMMMSKPEDVKFTPEEIDSMTPDELFESENVMKILNQMTEGYEPIIMSFDELEKEAQLRDLRPSTVLRKKGVGAGELVKRLYMYDIAMTKINDRLSGLLEKIQSGNYSAEDKMNFIATTIKQQELAARIFEDQGEIGRALAAMKTIQYTRRSVKGMSETLLQFKQGSPFEHLQDEEAFLKYAMGISDQMAAGKEKLKESSRDWAGNALNLPRALMSTFDLSAPLRQGLFLIHKKAWWNSFFNMFRYWADEQAFKDLRTDIMSRPTYGEMLRAKLALSDIDGKLNSKEEDFQTEWAQKIPGLGRLVRMSERAYSGFLNKLRADVFDQLLSKLPEGYTDKDLQDLGRFINAASGRGNLPKAMQSSAPLLNAMLFSPRLMASRIVMTTALVDPRTYTTMNKVARNEYIKSLLTVGGTAFLILSVAALGGADVEEDPRSSDFAKIKVGNVRYDILGGEGQYITLASRLFKNSTKTADGDTRPYGTEFGQSTRKDAVYKFVENKAAPIPSFVIDYLRGTNAIGEKFEADKVIVARFVPMFAQDVYENVQEEGLAKGVAVTSPALFGVGVQNYKSYSTDASRELNAPESFAMQTAKDGEYNNATVEDGIVKLDEKAQAEWANRLNTYIREWMKDEMAKPEWKTMTTEERKAVIKSVRDDARKETKLDMLELLQIEEVDDGE